MVGRVSSFRVDLEHLPCAAAAIRDGIFVAQNKLFEELTGWPASELVGQPMSAVLTRLLTPGDLAIVANRIRSHPPDAPRTGGRIWCRIKSATGEERPLRVEWRHAEELTLVTIVDAEPEAYGQEVTEALARAAGTLSEHATERDVLEHAVSALHARGFTATVLLFDGDDPLLVYGPHRTPYPAMGVNALPRPPREILELLNPRYMQRRAAFFQDGMRLVREAFPEPVAERVRALLPAQRMVQAPLFVASAPYGALVVTSDALNPLVATALELFAELVGKAVENVRLRAERVERERLAALGEAAGLMAHEVRNPVGAIMNALTLLRREPNATKEQEALLTVIDEESARLAHVVSQLLDLGRPLFPRPCAFEMEALTARAMRTLTTRGVLARRSVVLPDTRGTLAWMDPDLVELALINVLRNAAQSTTTDGTIRVSVDAQERTVTWIVEDDGPGIPEEVVQRLGQPFLTTRATGTGMGLAVVRRIAEASGGRLFVQRASLGGASVSLELPRPPE